MFTHTRKNTLPYTYVCRWCTAYPVQHYAPKIYAFWQKDQKQKYHVSQIVFDKLICRLRGENMNNPASSFSILLSLICGRQ